MSIYKSDDPNALMAAVQSIFNQTYICDLYLYCDGTVPSYLQKCIDVITSNEQVSFFYCKKNLGLASSLNKLIDEVIIEDYEFVARMDSDDISRINRIEKQVKFFEDNDDVDVCGTSCREFGASYALTEKHLPQNHKELLSFSVTRCPFIHPSVMFRSSVFHEGNRYPTDTTFTEDMSLWFLLLKKGYKFGNINEVLIDYRLNENTIERRKGISKALSEVRIRTVNMFLLKQFSFKNVFFIFSRVIFHLMPSVFVKFAYKKMR